MLDLYRMGSLAKTPASGELEMLKSTIAALHGIRTRITSVVSEVVVENVALALIR